MKIAPVGLLDCYRVWTYDNAGNIQSRTEYAYTNGDLGAVQDSAAYEYDDEHWGDLLTEYDGRSISYDEIGNPESDGVWSYTWEHGRELTAMGNGSTTWTFSYDANGMRTSRSNGTTTYKYVYNGGSLVQMTVGSNTLYFTSDTVTLNGITYYYVKNLQGDIVAILDANGIAVVQYTYDAWGNILSTSGTMADTLGMLNPIRYRGYVYDQESGLYYLQSRYYDPEIGRWINADDTAYLGADGTLLSNNLFAYCGNSPVNKIDKTGNLGLSIGLFIGASAVIGGLAGAFIAASTGGNILEGALEGAVLGAVAATATVLVPQLVAPLAKAVATTVATTAATQTMVATVVTTGATFVASGFTGMAVDWATQRIAHELGEKSNEKFKLDKGRVCKTGLTTGIAGVVPTYGEPAESVVNAVGSLVLGFDASFVNAAIEVAITKLIG